MAARTRRSLPFVLRTRVLPLRSFPLPVQFFLEAYLVKSHLVHVGQHDVTHLGRHLERAEQQQGWVDLKNHR